MTRKNKYRLRMIGVLMLVSQLALAAFVGKWLTAQYKEEKKGLQQNLEELYFKTHEHLLDSMLDKKITGAMIRDGRDSTVISAHQNVSYKTGFVIPNSTVNPEHALIYRKPPHESSDSMSPILVRGLRTFVVKLNNETGGPPIVHIDSLVLRSDFERSVKNQNVDLNVRWSGKGDKRGSLVLNVENNVSRGSAYVTNYQPLLFHKILPQLGFSTLLLVLCGMAFILSYTTVRKQLLLNAQKDSFISNMSHELKTPVATAKVAIEALRKFDGIQDPVKTRDYLQMASWEIDRLETLIANVLNNVQLENGRIAMQQQPVDIAILMQGMINSMQPLFAEKGKMVSYTSNTDHAIVNGDVVHVQGAIYNVIDNAIKYGGDRLTITLQKEPTELMISISDNGPGIPDVYRKKIFEKFFRIPSGNVHNVKGYGLGLNYAMYVVSAHNGNIHQENNEQGGATFIITLPIA